jgi:hypothetical protein
MNERVPIEQYIREYFVLKSFYFPRGLLKRDGPWLRIRTD